MEHPNISLDELENLLNEFLGLDTKVTPVEKYQESFSKIITHFKFSQHALPLGVKLHRMRVNWTGLDFPSLHDFWHPPLDKIVKGRMNLAGQPILYTSIGGNTAFREVNPPNDINISCIEFEVIEPIKLIDIGLMNYKLNHHQFLRQWAYNDEKAMKMIYNNDPHLLSLDRRLKAFIADSFTKVVNNGDEHLYNISIAIAQQFLLSEDVDGIAYPSVKSDIKDVNIGLKSIQAFLKLKPIRIDVLKLSADISPQGEKIFYPVIGCYEKIQFGQKIEYTKPQDIVGWANRIND